MRGVILFGIDQAVSTHLGTAERTDSAGVQTLIEFNVWRSRTRGLWSVRSAHTARPRSLRKLA
jgi:hypothetical protein